MMKTVVGGATPSGTFQEAARSTGEYVPQSLGQASLSSRLWSCENRGPHAPQRSGRYQGRLQSPDPSMFRSTIWVSHDQEASACARDDSVEHLRDQSVYAIEHNLETLRTRLTQVADLR